MVVFKVDQPRPTQSSCDLTEKRNDFGSPPESQAVRRPHVSPRTNLFAARSSTGWLTPAILEDIIERLSSHPEHAQFCAPKTASSLVPPCPARTATADTRRQLLLVAGTRDHTAVSCRRCASRNRLDLVVVPDGCHAMQEGTFRTIGLKPFQKALQHHWTSLLKDLLCSNTEQPGNHSSNATGCHLCVTCIFGYFLEDKCESIN